MKDIKKLGNSELEKVTGGNGFPDIHRAIFNADKCANCGECVEACPVEAIRKGYQTVVFDSYLCVGCGICVDTCPFEAFSMD